MIRKSGKLPGNVIKNSYNLEYDSNILEIQKESVQSEQNCLIVDDVLVTGGTMESAYKLIRQTGANVVGFCNLIEINGLGGYDRLCKYSRVLSLLKYNNNLSNKLLSNTYENKMYCQNISLLDDVNDNRIIIISVP